LFYLGLSELQLCQLHTHYHFTVSGTAALHEPSTLYHNIKAECSNIHVACCMVLFGCNIHFMTLTIWQQKPCYELLLGKYSVRTCR